MLLTTISSGQAQASGFSIKEVLQFKADGKPMMWSNKQVVTRKS
jgi:hypothetical protein